MNPADRSARTRLVTVVLAWAIAIGLVGSLVRWVVVREGNLAWDDADYLRRGLHNVGVAGSDGPLDVPRLIAATIQERPKPPWLIGWIEAGVLLLGRGDLAALLVFSSVVPYALLLAAVIAIARRRFGETAALMAVLVLAGSPMSLSFGAKVMVESFMALWILLILDTAAGVLERPTRGRALALGTALGCALLTKLTVALLLPVPALVFLVAYLRRYPLDRTAMRAAFWMAVPILVLAGPWYARNGHAAVEFALYSARYDILALAKPDITPRFERPAILAERLMGRPLMLLLPIAGWGIIRRWNQSRLADADFVRLALVGAVSGAAILLYPSYFDPRFLLPICPAAALVVAWGLRAAVEPGPRLWLVVVCAVLGAGIFQAATQLVGEPRTVTYWTTKALIDSLVNQHGVSSLANVGDCRDWNVCKTGLINEMRDDPADCFVLHDLSRNQPDAIARRIVNFDAIVVLDRNRLTPGLLDSSPGLNRAYGAVEPLLQEKRCFRRIEAQVAGLPPISVYLRRK